LVLRQHDAVASESISQENAVLDTVSKLDLQDFFHEVARAPESALVLDYDGTLSHFRLNRTEAFPYSGVTPLLQEIMVTGRTRVVLITGRRADELIPLLAISPHPEIWGIHGLERLHNDGLHEIEPVDQRTLDALSAADDWIDNLKLQHLAEHKPGSLAVHWRGLPEDAARDVRGRVLLGWLSIADRACLTIEEFDGGVEMRMAIRNKADAMQTVLAEMDVAAPVAYLGDDQSDEDAFRALHGRGLCVLVRPQWRETAANLWLRPPAQLLGFLRAWLEACLQKPSGSVRESWTTDYDAGLRHEQGEHPRRSS
jgi:trehalose 6-phosphate phosphatase